LTHPGIDGAFRRDTLNLWDKSLHSLFFFLENITRALFARAPAPAPKPALAGTLSNGLKWSSSSHGAAPGVTSGFHWVGGATKTWLQAAPTILHPNLTGEAVLLNISQNSSNSTRKAAPPKKPEPELFLKKPVCKTDPAFLGGAWFQQVRTPWLRVIVVSLGRAPGGPALTNRGGVAWRSGGPRTRATASRRSSGSTGGRRRTYGVTATGTYYLFLFF